MQIIPFSDLQTADLIVGAVYEGGSSGNIADDPLAKLLKGGNAGGFRYCGSVSDLNYIILYPSLDDRDWPDNIDTGTGMLIYHGDNKQPGYKLHQTPKKGNLVLKNLFANLHHKKKPRHNIPPVFLFSKFPTRNSLRSVQFRGVCAPGCINLGRSDDLKKLNRSAKLKRYQNYRAIFTILDIPKVSRSWVYDLESGITDSRHRPFVWKMWQKSGFYRPLRSRLTFSIRTIEEQLPLQKPRRAMLFKIYRHFISEPYKFAHFAAEIYQMVDSRATIVGINRSTDDSGYHIFGKYRMGLNVDPVYTDFVLEAKCYNPGLGDRKRKSIGDKEIDKILAHMQERQFSVLVTTSVVAEPAYQHSRAKGLPVIFLCGRDMVDILVSNKITSVKQLNEWLSKHYPNKWW